MVRRTSSRRSGGEEKSKARSGRGGLRGQAGRDQLEKELQHQKDREEARKNQVNKPYTFWMPDGDTREVAILDDEPYFFRYEHNLQDPRTGKFGLNILCKRDNDNCPICTETTKEGQYVMYLTVLDLKPYKNKDGVTVEFSRKLFAVKSQQQKKFIRRFEKDGTLRGAVYELSRDGAKSPVIGNDIEFIEFMAEDELGEYERTWKDRDGKRHTEDCSQPFDYDEFMPDQTVTEVCDEYEEVFGRRPRAAPGSSRDNDEEELQPRRRRGRGRRDEEEEDEDENWEDDVAKAEEDLEDDDDDDEPPFDTDDEEEEEEEEDVKPKRRTSRRKSAEAEEKPARRRRSSAGSRSGKSSEDDDAEPSGGSRRTARRPVRRRKG